MRRRDFIAGLVITTTFRRAQAQQKSRVYHVAIVSPALPVTTMTEAGSASYRAFLRELQRQGFVEGQNLVIERYSGEGRTEHFDDLARQVVGGSPDVIFAGSPELALRFKAATDTIPVVASLADPLAYGVVRSLARPGGNITGATVDAGVAIESKRLELLREMIPSASRVAFLAPRSISETPRRAAVREAAQKMKMSLVGPPVEAPSGEAEYRQVFAAMTQAGVEALIIGDESANYANRRLIVDLAEKARLPGIYASRLFVDVGGLMSYGTDVVDVLRHAAGQIAEILKGAKPGDIPIYQPTKFELVINAKTAKALGLTAPDSLLAQADEVVE